MIWKSVYRSVSCENCHKEFEKFGRRPKCEARGPDACDISSGKAPSLPPELQEVAEVFNLLSHPMIASSPALQQGVLDVYATQEKTREGHSFFFRMLCALYDISSEISPMLNANQPVGVDPSTGDLKLVSKGRA